MPKIIDHEAYRLELATKAVDVFIEHGYNGLGMRGIADAIGVSKSALYHYFPSKQELFSACTEIITQPSNLYGVAEGEVVPALKGEAIAAMIGVLDNRFQGEMALLLDYVRGKNAGEVAGDPLMNKANAQYLSEMENMVGESQANQAMALMLGGLLMRMLSGKQIGIDEITSWITALPSQEKGSDD
ncbi:TetR/AcrR family transcriptional regulator [Photobacterium sp. OFAV2-7]|uniref:TetR/AcrR family transcriptional regulator n=1 Tax=Photobacterium sp. OFAV2-7 TaxID=2917748 RepID=UPI001EF60A6E|nr:TetR/AcrR family transcriptional regulator [Photobacterium sp. OFAV2-7]MCG7585814.1 TetR/AcrR family transcriptional regulator [Photobacterium sp. OFAV2-7]